MSHNVGATFFDAIHAARQKGTPGSWIQDYNFGDFLRAGQTDSMEHAPGTGGFALQWLRTKGEAEAHGQLELERLRQEGLPNRTPRPGLEDSFGVAGKPDFQYNQAGAQGQADDIQGMLDPNDAAFQAQKIFGPLDRNLPPQEEDPRDRGRRLRQFLDSRIS